MTSIFSTYEKFQKKTSRGDTRGDPRAHLTADEDLLSKRRRAYGEPGCVTAREGLVVTKPKHPDRDVEGIL